MLTSITSLHATRTAPPTGAAVRPDARFDAQARRFLLRQRGIAEGVLAGLEALGITSLEQFVAIGAEQVCQRMSATHGFNVWGNRRQALCAAIEAARQAGAANGLPDSTRPAMGRAHPGSKTWTSQ